MSSENKYTKIKLLRQYLQQSDQDSDDPWRDDYGKAGIISYDILFALFSPLLLYCCYNGYYAYKLHKFRQKPFFIFYLSAFLVLAFRTLLFTDQWVHYGWTGYVIMGIISPTFMWIILGLSQVTISLHCIIKYKILYIQENQFLTHH